MLVLHKKFSTIFLQQIFRIVIFFLIKNSPLLIFPVTLLLIFVKFVSILGHFWKEQNDIDYERFWRRMRCRLFVALFSPLYKEETGRQKQTLKKRKQIKRLLILRSLFWELFLWYCCSQDETKFKVILASLKTNESLLCSFCYFFLFLNSLEGGG